MKKKKLKTLKLGKETISNINSNEVRGGRRMSLLWCPPETFENCPPQSVTICPSVNFCKPNDEIG